MVTSVRGSVVAPGWSSVLGGLGAAGGAVVVCSGGGPFSRIGRLAPSEVAISRVSFGSSRASLSPAISGGAPTPLSGGLARRASAGGVAGGSWRYPAAGAENAELQARKPAAGPLAKAKAGGAAAEPAAEDGRPMAWVA